MDYDYATFGSITWIFIQILLPSYLAATVTQIDVVNNHQKDNSA